MVGSIVVGLSDGPAGQRTLDWAAERAASTGQTLELIIVIGGAIGAVGEQAVVDALTVAADARLHEAADTLRAAGLTVLTSVRLGDPVRSLIAASEHADLLVIGSDGDGTGERRGAHGVRITAGSHVPVVVVPNVKTSTRSGVLVGVDGSETSSGAVAFAAAEADRLGEPLIVMSVWTPMDFPPNPVLVTSDYLSSMENATEEIVTAALGGVAEQYPNLVVEHRIERGFPSEELLRAAKSARLLVVGSHGRGAIARFLLGSISFEVLEAPTSVTAVVR